MTKDSKPLQTDFELLVSAMEIGMKPDSMEQKPISKMKKPIDPRQKTKLTSYFYPVKGV